MRTREALSTWKTVRLDEVATIQTGIAKGKRIDIERAVEVPYLRVANVQDGFVDLGEVKTIQVERAIVSRYELASGDVLLTEGGDYDKLGRGCVWRGQIRPCLHQNHIFAVRVREGQLTPDFLAQYVASPRGKAYFLACSKQTTNLASINSSQLRALPLPLPPLPEQRKIAAILSSVDDAIDKTQAVIDQLGVVKKAMMQDLLTKGLPGRHTKFKKTEIGMVPEEWELVPLTSVAHVQTGLAKGKTVDDGIELPYLRVANVQDGYVDLTEMKTVVVKESSIDRYKLRGGDVLFTEGGDADKLGRGCVWRGQIDPCLHQNHVFAVRPNDAKLAPDFLAAWAAAPRGKAYFMDCAKQTTNLASINSTQLKAFPVPLPSRGEQSEIINALASVGQRQDAERAILWGLQSTKSALMSVLLTGEVRVTPDEDAA